LRLARLVGDEVRRRGRHFLDPSLLTALELVAKRHRGDDARLDAFLDAVLARRNDRFRNQTYLALELLHLVRDDAAYGLDPDRMVALLMADVVRHERTACGVDERTRDTRIKHATRLAEAVDPAGTVELESEPAGWLALTALPVSLEHDEYFFLRALQAHEQVFTRLTAVLDAATAAVRAGRVAEAAVTVRFANVVFERAAMLFRLVATLRPEQFHAFREYTDGASAIQSEAYKRFELACGCPTPTRLRSEGFAAVPAVASEAPGRDSLAAAVRDLMGDTLVPPARYRALTEAIDDLESAHQRWKTTHHSLAMRMLGDARGSGYTAGVPYLRSRIDDRLFASAAPAAASADHPRAA
jgi:tryptophan 2,3-dioxygenase